MGRVKIGVIGTGNMGRNHVRVLHGLNNIYELVGIYDSNEIQAETIAGQYKTKKFDSVEELLDQVEAVVLAVPSSLHKKAGLVVAEHGVHALIEKPLATTSEDARVLADAFESRGLKLMIGHIERFNPAIQELDKVLDDKQIFYIEVHRYSPFSGSGRITDTSVVEDLMIHDVDLVCHLMKAQEIESIYGAGECIASKQTDFASCMLKFSNHTHATINASRVAQEKERSIYVHTKECSVYADLLAKTLTIATNANLKVDDRKGNAYIQEGVVQKIFVPIKEPLQSELIAFHDALEDAIPIPVDSKVAIQAIQICEQVVLQAKGEE